MWCILEKKKKKMKEPEAQEGGTCWPSHSGNIGCNPKTHVLTPYCCRRECLPVCMAEPQPFIPHPPYLCLFNILGHQGATISPKTRKGKWCVWFRCHHASCTHCSAQRGFFCLWWYVLLQSSSPHLPGQRELAERRGRKKEGKDLREVVRLINVTQTTLFPNPQHSLIQGL